MNVDSRGDILVVDDNPTNLRLLTEMLGQRGYTVRAASGGLQALKSVTVRPPELVLLDVCMPDLDGFTVCARLKREIRSARIPVIFLSALSDVEDKKRAFAAGGVDYITKPYQVEEVTARVATHLELSRSRQALQQAYEELEQRAEEKSRQLVAAREMQFQLAESLKESLEHTINAIALALEKRDPYTAGHQRNVAELSVAIAQQLGFDAPSIEGLRLGAMIHDLGKIQIPAEILNRPGRVSPVEFELIKEHPETGYEIVKGVAFPRPVGEMVRQHHERLDGSGYPQGLHGTEILVEAKIIAVADVVEAMSSHRPYRAALGLQSAIDEISRHRGKIYDREVVDAALALHRGGRLQWLLPSH